MFSKLMTEFPITVYGNLNKYSETISQARCRIFYKYDNRNGTYITDEFAEKLLASIPYTPVKGIYDFEGEDYEDHGDQRTEGRIYGIVPENPNFAWEKHLDEDGIEREYACVDVFLFTGLYKEAGEIINKAQSMELFPPSLKGEWQFIKGRRYFVFTEGCFLGLQVLGEEIEPCFEGAAFYTLVDSLKKIVEEYELKITKDSTGGRLMKLNFKLSDSQKFDAIWSLLNSSYNEESGWVIEYSICDIYDDYALVYNYENQTYERAYYSKDDEEDSVIIDEKVRAYVVDVTESEFNTLQTLRKLNGDTYEKLDETFGEISELREQNTQYAELVTNLTSEFEQKIEELDNDIATLKTDKAEYTSKLEEANQNISSLQEQNSALESYKAAIEKKEKEHVIETYSELLTEEILDSYREKFDEYSVIDLDKELAYELKNSNLSAFSKDSNPMIRKNNGLTGIEAILTRYKK